MMNTPRYSLLVVEDDTDVRYGLVDYFQIEGYDVEEAADGETALKMLRREPPFDLVLLDVMLPAKNGFEVLRESQALGVSSPVVMMTALGEQENILKGFGLGADDYVVKPFSIDVLQARVRAILQRTMPPAEAPMDICCFGDVEVNFSTHEARCGDEEVHLTMLEFDLLRYLIHNEGQVVTRRQLMKHVWGIEGDLITRTIDRHIASLRKKVETNREHPVHITTVYGLGYRFRS